MTSGSRRFASISRAVVLALWTSSWPAHVIAAQAPQASGQTPTVETIALTSGFLERATYDATAKRLTIFFDDRSSYRYANVPPETFASLKSSASNPDTFFRTSIRTSFSYTQLTTATRSVPHNRSRKSKPSKAQTAPVKPIDCPGLASMRRQDVVSDAIASVAYDSNTRCLVVYFNDRGTYGYENVPEDDYQHLLEKGADPGEYFNKNIKGQYEAQRLGP